MCLDCKAPGARYDDGVTIETTVICAVWHGDKAREKLFISHNQNLDAQSMPVSRIYVFDDGATPPAELAQNSVVVGKPLSIYEAWNVALSLVRTPFVINLNLDDRLASDGAERLTNKAREGFDLVAGDWQICYSQEETDTLLPSRPIAELPCVLGWPLPRGTLSRLGCGAERDTFGPGCLWRLSLHQELPRYPWRFDDGTPIKSLGDWLFWRELRIRNKKLGCVPFVIGNYHHHPHDQAEFRLAGQDDEKRGIQQMWMP